MGEHSSKKISRIFEERGLPDHGWTPLKKPLTLDIYRAWIEEEYHGEMQYLKTHLAFKEDPEKLLPKAFSALVVTQNYLPHPYPMSENPLQKAQLALYAQGEDYHLQFQKKLEEVAQELSLAFPEETFVAFTDSKPVLERDLAYRAGLGWVGKNTCLINEKKGSLFFIGEIYTTLKLENNIEVAPDRCGTCTRCLEVCPTEAFIAPRKMDARKCISYWTIEAKSHPPEALREKIGDWLFGCDLCQTVCPWNQKVFGAQLKSKPDGDGRKELIKELQFILESSNKSLQKTFDKTPLLRAAGVRLKRNALIVAANKNLFELEDLIATYLSHDRLAEIAQWSLKKLESGPKPPETMP